MNGIALVVQNASSSSEVPTQQHLRQWVLAATSERIHAAEVCIRIVDETEMTTLNEQYRHKQGSTNVLAFPQQPVAEADYNVVGDLNLLGDIVICAPVVEREAEQQGKSSTAHWAHMVVHSVLHLLGYDHEQQQAATEMEQLETEILATLNIPPPYEFNGAASSAGDTKK